MESFDWRDIASIAGLVLGALSLLFTEGFRSAMKTVFRFFGESRQQSRKRKWDERWLSKHDPYYAIAGILLNIFLFSLFAIGFAYVMLQIPSQGEETSWWIYILRIYLGWACIVLFGRVIIYGTNVGESREAILRADPRFIEKMDADYQRHLEEEALD